MSNPAFDGLCGIPLPHAIRGGTYIRCTYDINHSGEHSWKKYEDQLCIMGGISHKEVLIRAKQGSPAARAILGVPLNCSCTPIFTDEGELVDYMFAAKCEAHEPKSG